MISRNKFLSFLIGCMVTNSCFAAGPTYTNWTGQINPYIFFNTFNSCPMGSYVAKCGDITLDLNTISLLVEESGVKDNCWNKYEPYENMHYLLNKPTYDTVTNKYDLNNKFSNADECITSKEALKTLMNNIYNTCLSSYTCMKCPNNGTTDDTSAISETTPKHWTTFNTIADCYTTTGSDNKGTYNVIEANGYDGSCYYSY